MEHAFQIGDICLDCQQLGLSSKLKEFFINETEKIIKCESNSCIFPYADDFSSDEDTSPTLEPIVAKEQQTGNSLPNIVDAATVKSTNAAACEPAMICSSNDFLGSVNPATHHGFEEQLAPDQFNCTAELNPCKEPQATTNDSGSMECGFDLSFMMEEEVDSWTDLLHEALEKEMIFETGETSSAAIINEEKEVEAFTETAAKSQIFIISDEIIAKPTTPPQSQVEQKVASKSSTKTATKSAIKGSTKTLPAETGNTKNEAVLPDTSKPASLSAIAATAVNYIKSTLQQQFPTARNGTTTQHQVVDTNSQETKIETISQAFPKRTETDGLTESRKVRRKPTKVPLAKEESCDSQETKAETISEASPKRTESDGLEPVPLKEEACDSQTQKVLAMSIVDFAATSQPSAGGVFSKMELPRRAQGSKKKHKRSSEIAANGNATITHVMNVLNLKSE